MKIFMKKLAYLNCTLGFEMRVTFLTSHKYLFLRKFMLWKKNLKLMFKNISKFMGFLPLKLILISQLKTNKNFKNY